MVKRIKEELSNCCKARLGTSYGSEGTNSYYCGKCQNSCDPYIAPKKRVKKEECINCHNQKFVDASCMWCGLQTGEKQVKKEKECTNRFDCTCVKCVTAWREQNYPSRKKFNPTASTSHPCEHVFDSELLFPMCHKCGMDMPHTDPTSTSNPDTVSYTATVSLNDEKDIYRKEVWTTEEDWRKHVLYVWIRRLILVLLGMLLLAAWQRFSFDACQSAIVHTINPLFLH